MIRDIVDTYIEGKRTIITSSTNNGTSSLALYIANTILDEDRIVVYYNPSRDVDREFVEKYYSRVHKHAIWIESPLESFLEFLQETGYSYDHLIIDPGDILMVNKSLIPTLGALRKPGAGITFTSQIRQDPNKGWAPYSTVERVNAFDYSLWITNVTGNHPLFKMKYVDVFKQIRSGNNFISREIAKYTDEGNIIE